ncbi:MAG: saccharopine dehydrogenase C-terminal domain-containing protein [Phycisphaerae bacterium]
MKYVVFGVGRQGLAVIYDLIERCDASHVVAYDVDGRARERIAAVLAREAELVAFHAVSPADAASAAQIESQIADAACAISALPYALNPAVTRLCLGARVPLCDLGGNPDIVAEQARLCGESGLVLPDCGLAPGLNNLWAVHLRQAHGCTRIRALCGGIPARRMDDNPLQYKLLFSPWGLISEYSGRCAVLVGGKVESREALTGLEALPGERECFYTSNNSPLVFENLARIGVRDYEYKTVRWAGHLERVLLLKRLGFFCGNRALDGALAEALGTAEFLRFERGRDVDEVFLRVEGTADGGRAHSLELRVQADSRFTAMELTTSWGVTIPAYFVALSRAGRLPAGVAVVTLPRGCLPPERVIDSAWGLGEVERRTKVDVT